MLHFIPSQVFLITALWSTVRALSQPTSTGQVSGKITDKNTGLPIAGAQLTFIADTNPIYATTQANGTYSASLPEGSYTVHVSKNGYFNSSLSDVQAIPSEATSNHDGSLSTSTVYPWPFITPPVYSGILHSKILKFSPLPSYSKYWPDGGFRSLRSAPNDKSAPFITYISPDYRMTGPTTFIPDITGPAGSSVKNYPRMNASAHGNFVVLPVDPNIPIPPPANTGLRGDGTHYDYNSIWMSNIFRLSETSDPSAGPNELIGFCHNEDYFGWGYAKNGCATMSVGVRYSHDNGLSWTRSVPILTKLIQPQTHDECVALQGTGTPAAGTGDGTGAWNHITKQWIFLAQQSNFGKYAPSPGLVMSYSADPLARPGTWTYVNPVKNLTDPGLIGSTSRTLMHSDLVPFFGASPSIIRDSKNNIWHMIYKLWGGGIVYTNSTDLTRWVRPMKLALVNGATGTDYPVLIGDEGDALTTTGKAWLWYKSWGGGPTDYNMALLDFNKRQ